MLDHKLHRRLLLRWMGLTGAAAALPGVSLPPPRKLRAIQESDLPALTAINPILYTDDDLGVLELGKRIFQWQGWTVIDVIGSQEALEICRTQPISFVISDIMKPDMCGFDILSNLKADPLIRDIPLMFLSARCDPMSIRRAREMGAVEYMTKPYMVNEMVTAVRMRLLHCGRWNQEALARL